jgi:hypothetical protein
VQRHSIFAQVDDHRRGRVLGCAGLVHTLLGAGGMCVRACVRVCVGGWVGGGGWQGSSGAAPNATAGL